jgi:hypothetical protein
MLLRAVLLRVCAALLGASGPPSPPREPDPLEDPRAVHPHDRDRARRRTDRRALEREVQLLPPLRGAPPAPPIVPRLLPALDVRLDQAARYSHRHYGEHQGRLHPRMIVLHYTCGPSFASAWHTFANNRPRRGELPGLCAHYIVDQDGTIYGLVPPSIRCRHANGVNHRALGIEFVQRCLREGPAAVERAMLERAPQIEAALALVRHLRRRFRIADEDIIGHAMVNGHRAFNDLLGRTNDHGDWREGAVRAFLRRL